MRDTVVETDRGRVRGERRSGVATFLGIPYGAAPVGERRFREPVPLRWPGVRDARCYGPSSIQAPIVVRSGTPLSGILGPSDDPGMSEDCLVVNVWSADLTGRAPVMVWIHGGGYTTGSGSGAASNGASLAGGHGVVVVSLNHRLGLLGYLDLEAELGPEYRGSSNVSLLDLVGALTWVQENIATFGGDANNVTIFGCSGGGGKVASLLTVPRARGLVHKAIVESGPLFSLRDREAARRATRQVLDFLGVGARELLALPAEQLYEAQVALGAGGGPSVNGMSFAPTVDGEILPDYPEREFARGVAADIPLTIGTNRDEARFSLAVAPQLAAVDELSDEDLTYLVSPGFDGQPDGVIAGYRALYPDISNFDLRLLIETEQFRIRSLREADAKAEAGTAPVFCYRMDWASPAFPRCGAFHALEVPLVFHNCAGATALADDVGASEVARAMSAAWTSFAVTGHPATPEGTDWEPYRSDRRTTMIIDRSWRLECDPMREERKLWEGEALTHATRPWGRLMALPELASGSRA